MRSVAFCCVCLLTLLAGGCIDIQYGPRLPVDFVTEDQDLLGMWFVEDSGSTTRICTIEEIAIPVEDGLINPASFETYLVGSENAPAESESEQLVYETAYRITIRPHESSKHTQQNATQNQQRD